MPPHFPHPRPMPRPRPRFRGGYTGYYPFYPETQVIDVDRTGPALPWRVVAGTQIVFQSAGMQSALLFFKTANQKALGGVPIALQRWAGNGWQTEATRNGSLGDAVSEGASLGTFIFGAIAVIGLYYLL